MKLFGSLILAGVLLLASVAVGFDDPPPTCSIDPTQCAEPQEPPACSNC